MLLQRNFLKKCCVAGLKCFFGMLDFRMNANRGTWAPEGCQSAESNNWQRKNSTVSQFEAQTTALRNKKAASSFLETYFTLFQMTCPHSGVHVTLRNGQMCRLSLHWTRAGFFPSKQWVHHLSKSAKAATELTAILVHGKDVWTVESLALNPLQLYQ